MRTASIIALVAHFFVASCLSRGRREAPNKAYPSREVFVRNPADGVSAVLSDEPGFFWTNIPESSPPGLRPTMQTIYVPEEDIATEEGDIEANYSNSSSTRAGESSDSEPESIQKTPRTPQEPAVSENIRTNIDASFYHMQIFVDNTVDELTRIRLVFENPVFSEALMKQLNLDQKIFLQVDVGKVYLPKDDRNIYTTFRLYSEIPNQDLLHFNDGVISSALISIRPTDLLQVLGQKIRERRDGDSSCVLTIFIFKEYLLRFIPAGLSEEPKDAEGVSYFFFYNPREKEESVKEYLKITKESGGKRIDSIPANKSTERVARATLLTHFMSAIKSAVDLGTLGDALIHKWGLAQKSGMYELSFPGRGLGVNRSFFHNREGSIEFQSPSCNTNETDNTGRNQEPGVFTRCSWTCGPSCLPTCTQHSWFTSPSALRTLNSSNKRDERNLVAELLPSSPSRWKWDYPCFLGNEENRRQLNGEKNQINLQILNRIVLLLVNEKNRLQQVNDEKGETTVKNVQKVIDGVEYVLKPGIIYALKHHESPDILTQSLAYFVYVTLMEYPEIGQDAELLSLFLLNDTSSIMQKVNTTGEMEKAIISADALSDSFRGFILKSHNYTESERINATKNQTKPKIGQKDQSQASDFNVTSLSDEPAQGVVGHRVKKALSVVCISTAALFTTGSIAYMFMI